MGSYILSDNEQKLYSRNILVPEIGAAGQIRLKNSKVAVIGAGGLGSPVLQYLAGVGVGTITIIDGDRIELSNLNRQTIHDSSVIGEYKAQNAAHKLSLINPYIQTTAVTEFITDDNYHNILTGHDLIIDCTDGFETKLAILKYAQKLNIPLMHGGVTATRGQVMLVIPNKTPCFVCLTGEDAGQDLIGCSEAGIIGAAAGIIGAMMALETIKYIVGIGQKPGVIYFYDAMRNRLKEMKVEKNPGCGYCSDTHFDKGGEGDS